MPSSFSVEFKGDHVEVHSDGDKDLELASRLWREIVKTCTAHKCCSILGIARTTTPLSVIDGFDHAELMKEVGVTPDYRIAWVEPNPDGFEVIKFVETVLYNRSIATFKVFDDESFAREWLFSVQGV